MRSKIRVPLTALCLMSIILMLFSSGSAMVGATSEDESMSPSTSQQSEPPLRDSEPVEDIIADLVRYIPERMRQAGVPGLSIALIRDGEVAWVEGFGVANTVSGVRTRPDTVFEVASNSKVVTTYTALRLVQEGKLELDEPLASYLPKPWLPSSDYANEITLRHLASHSSGLSDTMLPQVDKTVAFAPGSAFRYSGVGAMYMQEAIEQVTGRSLADVAREVVFEPLGMASSSFVNDADALPRMANGHMRYTIPLLTFLIPCAVLVAVLGLIGLFVLRFVTGTWLPRGHIVLGACVAAGILTLLIVTLAVGRQLPNYVLLVALCAAGFGIAFTFLTFIGWQTIARLPAGWCGSIAGYALKMVWLGLSLIALVWLSGLITGPVPRRPSPRPSAVGSLRTSASDLATFLIELAEPRYLSPELAAQIRTPQVSISRDFSWGLGPGIQHSRQGDALWQNGITFGFRSVMVIYPERRIGVVVLTNSDEGLPVAYDVAQRALGGKAQWEDF
jgi:CubicO group peptidase (beta-lactamase class C family)